MCVYTSTKFRVPMVLSKKNIKGTGGGLRRVPVLSDLSVFGFFALRKINPLVVSTRDLSTIPTAPTIHLCSHRACEVRSGELWNKPCSPLVCINRTRPRAAQDPRCPRCCAAHSQNTAAAISLPKSSRCRPIPTLTLTAYRARNNE